ncbi:MAG: hypothetical protein KGJ66_03085 [Alphaproteobacteria bacterium]|nr:hypothetical protein [Alphaproteobacteria bacterium]
MRTSRWLLPAIALVALAVPARAEIVTLVCDTNCTPNTCSAPIATKMAFDIDFGTSKVGVYLPEMGPGQSDESRWQSAEITDRAITIPSLKITINRLLGIVTYSNGTTGKCQRAGKPLL